MFTTGPCRVSVVKLKIRTIAGPDGSVVDRLAIVVPNGTGIGHPGGKFKVGHFEPFRNLMLYGRELGGGIPATIIQTMRPPIPPWVKKAWVEQFKLK